MKQPCGCCAGIEIVTPQSEVNRPGLPAIAYRAGTYATFLESMLARVSSLYLDIPAGDGSGAVQRVCPLKNLTTRDLSDPSIALMDAWATVADVLTFYQERIANEGYLRTATERFSILELARLIGYRLRPGISASVYLAFTVADGFNGTIPTGTRAQSIPGAGETPQFFETYEDLPARDVWNSLKPRLTRPQVITSPEKDRQDIPIPTGADVIDTIYFQGVSTNLDTGAALLIVLSDDINQQVLRKVRSVNVDATNKRTEVVLDYPQPSPQTTVPATLSDALRPLIDQASVLFADSDIAGHVSTILNQVLAEITSSTEIIDAVDLLQASLPDLENDHDLALKREFTRLEPWIANVIDTINTLIKEIPRIRVALAASLEIVGKIPAPTPQFASPIENLTNIIKQLSLPPSLQPANAQRLPRTIQQAFSPQSDIAPRLLAAFHPAAATTIYKAWAGVETPASQVEVYAFRARAGLFPGSYPGAVTVTGNPLRGGTTTHFTPPSLENSWNKVFTADPPFATVALDGVYDKVKAGSWVGIERPELNDDCTLKSIAPSPTRTFHKVVSSLTVYMATSDNGYTAKVTQLTLDPKWLEDISSEKNFGCYVKSPEFLHGVVVYLQTDPLDMAEEPLDSDIEKSTVELAQLYDGLDAGRWIIVSGERTDIPNTTGVTAAELVMIASVEQGSRTPGCETPFPFPSGSFPFSQYLYTTQANKYGDRLVVGVVDDYEALLKLFPDPPDSTSRQYCDQAQLAQGIYVNAYVPTKRELLDRSFPDFAGLLYNPDPKSLQPYPDGVIPPSREKSQIWAWRISSEPVHTILTLANDLAYTYDRTTATIYANVVKATHGQSVAEALGNGDASQALLNFTLHQPPLTYLPAPTPAGAQDALSVLVNDVEWQEADNLLALGPNDRDFITQTDDSGLTMVIFGNGEHGARTPTGIANVKAIYRSGTGQAGNVQAQQISQLVTQPPGAKNVINLLPASGGADGDTRDQARQNAPVAVIALDRLVSVLDYADFSRTYAGIGKANAARLSDGRRLVVHVTIAGKDDIAIDENSDLYQNLVQALLQNGDPHQPIQVDPRRLKLLVISAGVKVQANYVWESVQPNVQSSLLNYFGFEQRDLGQSAFTSEAISVMQAVEGVEYVDLKTFDSVPESIDAKQLAALAQSLTLNNVEAELAHVNPSPTGPLDRILSAELAILTPDIPGALILTEITS